MQHNDCSEDKKYELSSMIAPGSWLEFSGHSAGGDTARAWWPLEVGRQGSQFEEANVKLTGQNVKRNNCLEKGRHMKNFLWLMELY